MTYNNKVPYFPKATCLWLIENTSLTFKQIADFCGIHDLEIKSYVDGDIDWMVQPADPIANGQLLKEEIERCTNDSTASLTLFISPTQELMNKNSKKNKSTYTPIYKRHDKPNAIAWLIKNYPDLKDSDIIRLIGTTKTTISDIKNRTHKNIKNIKPRDPVTLGLTTQTNLNNAIDSLSSHNKKDEHAASYNDRSEG